MRVRLRLNYKYTLFAEGTALQSLSLINRSTATF